MKLKTHEGFLAYSSDIHFDNEECFCGRPYISLLVFTENNIVHDAGTILISIHDKDDFDVGLKYMSNLNNFKNILSELLDWMKEKENKICAYMDIWKPFEFFPDCNCERILW